MAASEVVIEPAIDRGVRVFPPLLLLPEANTGVGQTQLIKRKSHPGCFAGLVLPESDAVFPHIVAFPGPEKADDNSRAQKNDGGSFLGDTGKQKNCCRYNRESGWQVGAMFKNKVQADD